MNHPQIKSTLFFFKKKSSSIAILSGKVKSLAFSRYLIFRCWMTKLKKNLNTLNKSRLILKFLFTGYSDNWVWNIIKNLRWVSIQLFCICYIFLRYCALEHELENNEKIEIEWFIFVYLNVAEHFIFLLVNSKNCKTDLLCVFLILCPWFCY